MGQLPIDVFATRSTCSYLNEKPFGDYGQGVYYFFLRKMFCTYHNKYNKLHIITSRGMV